MGFAFPTNPINALEARKLRVALAARRLWFPTNPINALEASIPLLADLRGSEGFQLIQLTHWKRELYGFIGEAALFAFPTNPINALEASEGRESQSFGAQEFPTNPINALEASENVFGQLRVEKLSFQLIQLTHWKRGEKAEGRD